MAKPSFDQNPFYFKFVFMIFGTLNALYQLFARFVYQEAGLMATGISYQAATKDKPENYNTIRSTQVLVNLSAADTKELFGTWNMRTQYYLKHYVMMRQIDRSLPRGQMQGFPIAITFIVSALNHGFFAGYYILFFGAGLLEFSYRLGEKTAIAALLRKKLPISLVTITSALFLQCQMRFFSIAIWILTWENVSAAYNAVHWVGFIMPVAIILLSMILPKAPRKPRAKISTSVDTSEVNTDGLKI